MAEYKRHEAREWAREKMQGVANVIQPTFTQDLQKLNEKAIRYDVNKEIEYGFWGALLVAETATTFDEYIQFTEWAVDEAKGRLRLIHHASFNTLEENIRAVQAAEYAGVELVLLSYPPTFYPKSSSEIYEYTKAFCEQTNLGVILFPVPYWNFERLHPAGFDPQLTRRLVKDVPNIVSIKAEQGMPTIAGFIQTFKELGDEVVVTFPVEDQGLPLSAVVPMQFMGTSNSEYYGPMIPKIFNMIRGGQFQQAMDLYWQIHPARRASAAAMSSISGANFIHRLLWKYQGWLSGFNGGPLRQPTMRITQPQMNALRKGLQDSGLPVTEEPDEAFFIGRNPS